MHPRFHQREFGRIAPLRLFLVSALVGAPFAYPPTALGAQSRAATLSADGAKIAYQSSGRGEPVLVFVHGWTCDQTHWREQVKYFSANHRVITLDLAGHGRSETPNRAWTIRNFAADVAAVVKAADARRVVLIGHSLGGPVVAEAALLLPRQTLAIVGVDTFFDAWDTPGFAGLIDGLRGDWPNVSKAFARGMFTARSDTALVTRVTSAMTRASPAMAVPALADMRVWWHDRFDSTMAAVRVPVGVIQASADGHERLNAHRQSLALLDTAVMPGLGHFLMLEDPAQFDHVLEAQLKRLVPQPQQ
jgi:pimeloyl-ACP methyl ester carboxylesterase